MRFKKIEFKNVFSYGNDLKTIEFDENGALWQLCGLSGAGKTSIIQLPYLVLFGETISGVKLTGIANRVNSKDSLIKGYISDGKSDYVITRSFSPHTISVEKDGVAIDLPGIDAKQEYIQSQIMHGIPKNVYRNTLTLSLNTEVSFIDMGAKDKRNIIDYLLDMEVVNYYSELLKKDILSVTQSINECNGSLGAIDRSLGRAKTDLVNKETSLNSTDELRHTKEEIENKIVEIRDKYIKGRQDTIQSEQNEVWSLQRGMPELTSKKSQAHTRMMDVQRQLNDISNGICPTCGTPTEGDRFDNLRETYRAAIDNYSSEIREADNQLCDIQSNISKKTANISKLQMEVNVLSRKIDELNGEILKSEMKRNAQNTYEDARKVVESLENDKKEEQRKISEKEHSAALLDILKGVYSDKGVKKVLRDRYVPELNRQINKSLKEMNIPYTIDFDSNFEASLMDRGNKVQIETLSGGEKQRANIAVLYSLIKIVKDKYPTINVIALDETTSHLDPENGLDTFRFFKKMADEMRLNIFTVTHTDISDSSIFDRRLFIEKKNGFSSVTVA